MDGPLRRVVIARPGNDKQGNQDKGFEAFYTGAWWLKLSCGHVRVIPRSGFDGPHTARCVSTCFVTRRLYGRHTTPHGFLKDQRPIVVEGWEAKE